MEPTKPINFELTTPFKYAPGNGEEIECNFIELSEPTGKQSHICCDIESLIQSGIMKIAGLLDEATIKQAQEDAKDKKKPDDEPAMDADAVLSMMTGGGVDMNKVVLHFRELFKEVAKMGGEKLITAGRLEDMSHKDFRRMMGVYAANFILSS